MKTDAVELLRQPPPDLLDEMWELVPREYEIDTRDVESVREMLRMIANSLEARIRP